MFMLPLCIIIRPLCPRQILRNTMFDLLRIDMNDSSQHKIMEEMTTNYRNELVAFPESLSKETDQSTSLTYF